MGLKKVPEGKLREGFTTGTSATAAAKAGLLSIVLQQKQEHVPVHLPIDKVLNIAIHSCEFTAQTAKCSVLKDAGDDPDVTNGAEIGCKIQFTKEQEITFLAGEGVGTVTLPGLQLNVGEPAINPVPRQMIRNALQKILHDYDLEVGIAVTVFVINGKKLAKKTLNERVGIMNGLSILGTSGIVKPYSASSYIASIEQGVDVAVANGITELVINSGARSEKYLKQLFPALTEQSFIHYGNWIGDTLRKINTSPIKKVTMGIMLGKAVKLAQGQTDTHSCVSSWDKEFIGNIALQSGYSQNQKDHILQLNMASRLVEVIPFQEDETFYQALLLKCYLEIRTLFKHTTFHLFLIGKDGDYIQLKHI
ncbi:cobalt-precorrin-5B (C(1))-methyltransferase CbiD [Flammeovirga kamogawensis]|uniref:Cobalt-precorrin-5B C(1)-methyltransferase n=1 Tax=Flammeovirga kamogawensis TaxID=373891 RepID=A0ABX8H413_9BACT|nr:cobalt-precorrin-5B (C(1))-methyltransferase CbiD [Flammeovirga kamogawensis]MBB6460343.1 cobalt-precorrin-5B (C1)-methyltransferase [Flammeovirga kamogawensis]QWG10152.1 cobalt-precorrin-5B (C(1))-methyltransferase CbiD [Flammeovirga kamogawensis]TRX64604.1 cobalt-precorrin-5B (C(1))-methyltransferase [Flammeovirga kamogawensis]